MDDLEILALPCDLGTFQFDPRWRDVRRAIDVAHKHASERLNYLFIARPKIVAKLLHDFRLKAHERLLEEGFGGDAKLRVAAIEPIWPRYRAIPLNFRVTETCGFAEDTDDRLMLDAGNTAAPRAFKEQRPIVWPPEDVSFEGCVEYARMEPMTKYERTMIRPGLRSILSIPVFRDSSDWLLPVAERRERTERKLTLPIGVVAIDSDQDCRNLFRTQRFLDFIVQETGGLAEIFLRGYTGSRTDGSRRSSFDD